MMKNNKTIRELSDKELNLVNGGWYYEDVAIYETHPEYGDVIIVATDPAGF